LCRRYGELEEKAYGVSTSIGGIDPKFRHPSQTRRRRPGQARSALLKKIELDRDLKTLIDAYFSADYEGALDPDVLADLQAWREGLGDRIRELRGQG
jgi:hypothetical protein